MDTNNVERRLPLKSADEQDVHTRWRRYYVYLQRAGVTSRIKRQTRRRERRHNKLDVYNRLDDPT